jgi:glycosyltransferase involved in cell wall biosynthesis
MTQIQDPTVSFVVPCYKLGHLLKECVDSILAQTCANFEILIMDDCSPDDTAEVARAFEDPRIKYIRNDSNIGALRNYNKGINLSRGRYVWLISADDYLKCAYVLQRYVEVMDASPRVGYVFCPGLAVSGGKEQGTIEYSAYGNRDRIVSGRTFLRILLYYDLVLAPAAMARREYYEKFSLFPVDLSWAGVPIDFIWCGDWYLWCLFALYGDVAYFAEPMVCYRLHDLSSTSVTTTANLRNCFLSEVAMRWMIKSKADVLGYRDVSRQCLHTIATEYSRHLTGKKYPLSTSKISMADFEESLFKNAADAKERQWIRRRVLAQVMIRRLVLSLGKLGDFVSKILRKIR